MAEMRSAGFVSPSCGSAGARTWRFRRRGRIKFKLVISGSAFRCCYCARGGKGARIRRRGTAGGDLVLRGACGALEAQTAGGQIRIGETGGSVDARTLNGSIEEVNVSGRIQARSLNGNISISMRTLGGRSEPIQMETVNGHLFLGLPTDASAALSLATVAGRIDCTFALQVSDRPGDASWRAVLGPGGTPVRLRTVRGNIQVVESSEVL